MDAFAQFEAALASMPIIDLARLPQAEPIQTAEERRAEWLKQRWGKFTASEFHKLMTHEDKTELPKGGQTYARKKAVELLTECVPDGYISPAMQWGIDHEHEALDAFIAATGLEVQDGKDGQVFLTLGDAVGGTPDGIIKSLNSGIEIKCPNSETHLDYLDNVTDAASLRFIAPEYYWQCQGLMLITGATSWFFVSYDPRFLDEGLRLHIATIERDDDDIARLQKRLDQAVEYRDAIVAKRIGSDPARMVRQSVALVSKRQDTILDKLAWLQQRLEKLEAERNEPVSSRAERKRVRAEKQQTPTPTLEPETEKTPIMAERPEVAPDSDGDDDDMDIDDAEGLLSQIDTDTGEIIHAVQSHTPSQAYLDWEKNIKAIDTISGIGRAAHEIKEDRTIRKDENEALLRMLVNRQMEIRRS